MPVMPDTLEHLYLAYLGRPQDYSGAQTYGPPARVLQPEAFAPFWHAPEFASAASLEAQVRGIYLTLFDREAEAPALAAWVAEVNAGRLASTLLPIAILQAAQNADAVSVAHKTAAARAFFDRLDTAQEILGYHGEASAGLARAFLRTVDSDPASLANAIASLDDTIARITDRGVIFDVEAQVVGVPLQTGG